jgi:Tol biopolymer transport system component
MSPEQIEGGKTITPAVDVWAWGGIVTYAATGRYPFGEGNAPVLLYRALHEDPQLGGLDESLHPIVWHAMRKDPASRPTAQQLIASLLGEPPSTPTEVSEREVTQLLQDWRLPAPSGPTGATGAPHTGSYPGTRTGPGSDTRTQLVTGGAGGPTTGYPPVTQEPQQRGKRRTGWVVAGVAVAVAAVLAAVLLVLPGGGSSGSESGGGAASGDVAAGPPRDILPKSAAALSDQTLVYMSERNGNRDIYSVEVGPNGAAVQGSEKRLTTGPEPDVLPIVMPGRRTVIFTRPGSPPTLFAVAADGSGKPKQLFTSGPASEITIAPDSRASASPSGNEVVIKASDGPNEGGLYVLAVDGSSQRRLPAVAQATDPSWSPDGNQVAYFSPPPTGAGDGGNLVIVRADGTNTPVTITNPTRNPAPPGQERGLVDNGPDGLDADPTWSPDGKNLVFRRAIGGDLNNMELFRMSLSAPGQVTQLTDVPGRNQDPGYSISGAQVAFNSTREGNNPQIYVMDPRRPLSEAVLLTTNPGLDTTPRWGGG